MKAAVIHEQGGPDVLRYEDIPDPVPGPGEVVIDVEVISLEGGDLLNRSILPVAHFPHVIGYQAAGRVSAVGADVTRFKVGDRTTCFAFSGSHAEKFCVPEHHAFAVPEGLDLRIAATMPVTFGTADDALFEAGHLKADETVLIQGGAGGVGLAAIQLAKAAGARVFATARNHHAEAMRAYGCDRPIAYDTEDFAEVIAAETGGRGVDLVVDLVGGDAAMVSRLISAVGYRGRLAVVGLSSGEAPSIPFWEIVPKNMAVLGVLFGAEMHSPRAHAKLARHFASAAAGRLTMPIAAAFPLSEAAAAHRFVEETRPLGRVLLLP